MTEIVARRTVRPPSPEHFAYSQDQGSTNISEYILLKFVLALSSMTILLAFFYLTFSTSFRLSTTHNVTYPATNIKAAT
jgi:hypothetical protein